MSKKRKVTKAELEMVEEARQIMRARLLSRKARFERAQNGDSDTLMVLMNEAGLVSQEGLDDYFKIKEQYGN